MINGAPPKYLRPVFGATPVKPAKAGIQCGAFWIAACAAMTLHVVPAKAGTQSSIVAGVQCGVPSGYRPSPV